MIIFVRHAAPAVDEQLPAAEWPLSDDGRAAARRLAFALSHFDIDSITTSTEVKAIQTGECLASVLGVELRSDRQLGEVDRPMLATGFEVAVARYFNGEDCDRWEPREAVRQRFAAALAEVPQKGNTAIVTHGTALTIYLATVATIDEIQFWRDLTRPDAWALVDGQLTRIGAA
jgi:broad specificity phosphatase PhoE